ncbi:Putative RNA recognition motif domain, CID domain, RNA-binding domain superfamily [Colletotrichum destructivum]|uniref:RNA recognition motif domain, CID domain, RNA-binding domain superfamily n=1 Tax=Colletotrichum destructivum TaxID=34406 RepID=A0AAX4IDI0_9PEZI|nr:Putative RNA recognition motif domain, CID domain, RNA-binding domain superfamily [Colletotrichum destructivum]
MATAAPVVELEAALKAISDYKAPGVTGTRIAAMTSICVQNVQYESVLIQKLFTYLKMATPPYKLGILYVVDSVIRKWREQALFHKQTTDENAADGTYGAGVYRLTTLMPSLINDVLRILPDGYQDKLNKLLEIWHKGGTFPPEMIESFQYKLDITLVPAPVLSYTPEGSPPPDLVERMGYNRPVAAPSAPAQMSAPDATNILAKLQKLAKASQEQSLNSIQNQTHGRPHDGGHNQTYGQPQHEGQNRHNSQGHDNGQPHNLAQPQIPVQAQSNSQVPSPLQELLSKISTFGQSQPQPQPQPQPSVPSMNSQQSSYSMAPLSGGISAALAPAPAPLPFPQLQPQPGGMQFPGLPQMSQMPQLPQIPQWPQMPQMPQMPQIPQTTQSLAGVPPTAVDQMTMFQTLLNQGISAEHLAAMIAAVNGGQSGAAPVAPPVSVAPTVTAAQNYYTSGQGYGGSAQLYGNSDQHRYNDRARSPDRLQGRSRSRSPGRHWDQRGSSRDPRENGADYGRRSPDRGRHNSRDSRRGSDYRQRSPPPSRDGGRSNSSRHGSSDKWIDYDQSLPEGHIKVLSRTLFVGGLNGMPERQIRDIFSRYGQVQTVIINKEGRHAFVKMTNRPDAARAKAAMEKLAEQRRRGGTPPLRVRWGVGYGPRDACNYGKGVSVILIDVLTDADRKWMFTAEYGGTGGKPLTSGMVVEEPDIEIGAGVSSKAISKHMKTDKSGNNGPRSTRSGRDASRDDPGHWQSGRKDAKVSGANAQPLPQQFPFGIGTLPNGMPAYPPGFAFPASKGN